MEDSIQIKAVVRVEHGTMMSYPPNLLCYRHGLQVQYVRVCWREVDAWADATLCQAQESLRGSVRQLLRSVVGCSSETG